MPQEVYTRLDEEVLSGTSKPRTGYFVAIILLGLGIIFAASAWLKQVKTGMGVTNLHQPVDWGIYLSNFIYWVGLAHSGTLISAIFFLARARWRDAVSRATEAMTLIAIAIAGMFPLIHLGRFWVVYFIIPYPSQRQIWPNFTSPLLWDVLAISTYLTVSTIFFYVGILPDVAAFRDICETKLGRDHWKSRFYRIIASGWSGAGGQWRHYRRSYMYFAALVTPLVISVHSIVSWDFAMANISGWHSTLFAPYFVAGAIHSGLAMAFILLIALRRFLNLQNIIRMDNLEMIAKTMLVTTAIMAYSYFIEPLMDWYSGDKFDIQYYYWQMTGGPGPVYWSLYFFNVLVPGLLVFKRLRRSIPYLFAVGILVNIGMYMERCMIVWAGLAHDYMPHNWSAYLPNDVVEMGISIGAYCFFFFFYLSFAKTLPTVALADMKERVGEEQLENLQVRDLAPMQERKIAPGRPSVTGVYGDADALVRAVEKVRSAGFMLVEFFSPVKLEKLARAFGHEKSPVRYWTLIGAISGLIGGFWLAIGSADVNQLIVGGKHPVSLVPYCIVGFEGLILCGSLANLAGFFFHTFPYRRSRVQYDKRFSRNQFGLVVASEPSHFNDLKALMAGTGAEDVHVNG